MGKNVGIKIRHKPVLFLSGIFAPCLVFIFALGWIAFGPVRPLDVNASDPRTPALLSPETNAVIKGNPRLAWQVSNSADVSYYIYESYYDAALSSKIFTANVTGSSRNITGDQTIELWWRVIAVHKDGTKHPSEARHLFVDNSVPVALLNITSPNAQPGYYGQTVNITGVTDAQEKNIATHQFEVLNPDGSVENVGPIAAVSNSYSFKLNTSIGEGAYKITYTAVDKAGNVSKPALKMINVDTASPFAPVLTGAIVRDIKPGLVSRSWSKSMSEDVYSYFYKSFKSFDDAANHTETAVANFTYTYLTTQNSYDLIGQSGSRERTFYYRVAAIDKAGNKTWSSEIHSVTVDGTPPPAPSIQITDLTNGALTNKTATAATWNKPSEDTLKYNLRYYTNIPGNSNTQTAPSVTELTAEQWSGVLSEGTGQYTFQVQAVDRAGNESPWSDIFVINLDTIPPTVIVNPITSIETPNSATITAAIQDPTITKATIVITGATGGVVTNTEVTVINGVVTYELATPAVDTYTVTVTAKDVADNETTSLAQTFTVKAHVVIAPEEKPAVPVNSGSSNNTPANPAPADDDTAPAGNTVAQNTAPNAEGEVFDDTDAAQNPQPRANTFGVDGGGTNDAQEIQGISDTKPFDWGFGVQWWGWLFGIATIAGGWWIIAGIRRRRQHNE